MTVEELIIALQKCDRTKEVGILCSGDFDELAVGIVDSIEEDDSCVNIVDSTYKLDR